MKIRYLEERERAGGTAYVVNPPKYVREATGFTYRGFDSDRKAALAYALQVSEAFDAQKAGRAVERRSYAASVQSVVDGYLKSQRFRGLAENSRINYRYNLEIALHMQVHAQEMAKFPAEAIDADFADDFADLLGEEYSYRRVFEIIQRLSTVWQAQLRRGKVKGNPWSGMGLRAPADRQVVWSRGQIAKFVDAADKAGESFLGTFILLCYELCQRPCDIRALEWAQLQDRVFTLTQIKTGIEVYCPVSTGLLERLTRYRHNYRHVIVTDEGEPWGREINKAVARIRKLAGLPPDLWASDLRRTGATELGEAGATEDEIRSITGHTSRAKLNIYVKPGQRTARNAGVKRFGE